MRGCSGPHAQPDFLSEAAAALPALYGVPGPLASLVGTKGPWVASPRDPIPLLPWDRDPLSTGVTQRCRGHKCLSHIFYLLSPLDRRVGLGDSSPAPRLQCTPSWSPWQLGHSRDQQDRKGAWELAIHRDVLASTTGFGRSFSVHGLACAKVLGHLRAQLGTAAARRRGRRGGGQGTGGLCEDLRATRRGLCPREVAARGRCMPVVYLIRRLRQGDHGKRERGSMGRWGRRGRGRKEKILKIQTD